MEQAAERQTVFLSAGGTGGHLFPAEALARVLKARGFEVHLLTDSRARRFINIEGGGFKAENIHEIDSATFAGKNPLRLARAAFKLARGFWQARRLIRRHHPVLLAGFGGYPTLPPLYAAHRQSVPVLLHEQNAVMGRANRLAAGFAAAIAMGFPPAKPMAQAKALKAKTHLTGNPLRPAVLAAAKIPYQPAGAHQQFTLLVFGGSQGAGFFSAIMPQALALLPPDCLARLRLIQQARPADEAGLRAAYAELGIKAEIAVFFKNLPALMAQAQFIVARAGASTVAEIAAIGRPCLLVPYPKALDNDQLYNAAALAALGGAETAAEAQLDAKKLAAVLTRAMQLPQLLRHKAQAAACAGKHDAAEKLADLAIDIIKRNEEQKL